MNKFEFSWFKNKVKLISVTLNTLHFFYTLATTFFTLHGSSWAAVKSKIETNEQKFCKMKNETPFYIAISYKKR